jgi:membrane protease YdiL (CAAX protease family)
VTDEPDAAAGPAQASAELDGSPPAPAPLFSRVRVRWLVPWAIGALVAVGIVASLSGSPGPSLSGGFGAWLGVGIYAGLLVWELAILDRAGISLASFTRWPPRDELRLAWLGLALAVISVGTLFLTMLPVTLVAPQLVRGLLRTHDALPASGQLSAITVLIAVVIAPPLEELLFRGILFQRWAYKWGVPRAAVLSSICFGVLHADPIGKFIFGMVMIWLYVRTDSLVVPALAHALHNAVFVLPALLPAAPAKPTDPLQLIRSGWPAALASLAVGCLVVAFVTRGTGRLRSWQLPPVSPVVHPAGR